LRLYQQPWPIVGQGQKVPLARRPAGQDHRILPAIADRTISRQSSPPIHPAPFYSARLRLDGLENKKKIRAYTDYPSNSDVSRQMTKLLRDIKTAMTTNAIVENILRLPWFAVVVAATDALKSVTPTAGYPIPDRPAGPIV
jgi:hypothetical protein